MDSIMEFYQSAVEVYQGLKPQLELLKSKSKVISNARRHFSHLLQSYDSFSASELEQSRQRFEQVHFPSTFTSMDVFTVSYKCFQLHFCLIAVATHHPVCHHSIQAASCLQTRLLISLHQNHLGA